MHHGSTIEKQTKLFLRSTKQREAPQHTITALTGTTPPSTEQPTWIALAKGMAHTSRTEPAP